MSKKEICAHDMNELLPIIRYVIEHEEINISSMCKDTGIPRSTLYDFLFQDSKELARIQKIMSYLGLEISIKPTAEKQWTFFLSNISDKQMIMQKYLCIIVPKGGIQNVKVQNY